MFYVRIFAVLIVIVAVLVVFSVVFKQDRGEGKTRKKRIKQKDRNSIIRYANKRLSQNSKDPEALSSLADLFYREEDYFKAKKYYKDLIDLCAAYPEISEFDVTLRYALSSQKLKNFDEAYKAFLIAKSVNANNFEVNFNLGVLEYQRKNFERATAFLQQAKKSQPDHVQTTRFLGNSLFKIKKYSDAIMALKSAIEYEPDDKESLFSLAQCYFKNGNNENALSIFSHLRADPAIGSHAALFSGTIHTNNKNYQKAIMDFELGLKHQNINPPVVLELKYRLAGVYVKEQEIDRALKLLHEIQESNAEFKDIEDLIGKYQELSNNHILQTFLISPVSEFVSLCRKIASNFYQESRSKLIDISIIKNEYIDILAEISAKRWEDLVLFRFVRSTGMVGELVLREMYARCKELRAGRGFCLAAGSFSEGAKQFVEARLIDLIDKKELMQLFTRLAQIEGATKRGLVVGID